MLTQPNLFWSRYIVFFTSFPPSNDPWNMFIFQESIVATNVQIEQDKKKKSEERETDRALAIYLTNGPFQPNPIWIVTNFFFFFSLVLLVDTSYREINPINVKLINTQKVKLLLLTKLKSFSSFFSMKDALICLSCVLAARLASPCLHHLLSQYQNHQKRKRPKMHITRKKGKKREKHTK